MKRIELSASEIAKSSGARNELAVQSSLYLLERAGHIARTAAFENRSRVQEPPPWGNTGNVKTERAGVSPATAATNSTRIRPPGRAARAILMLDNAPATKLRLTPGDVERRAGQERRKLREMIELCYTEHCYRAHILDYFGDRHHARQCGTCGNCAPKGSATPSAEFSAGQDYAGDEAPELRALTDDELL